MDQFTEQLYELDSRLRKGLSLGKDLTKTQKLRDSAQSTQRKINENAGEVLDLKAEIVQMKNKLFIADQHHLEEANVLRQKIGLQDQ